MHIDNIRLGHACNSSSSHSFIIPDVEIETDEWSSFGWQKFTVAPQDIDTYIAAAIWGGVRYDFDRTNLREDILEELGVEVPENAETYEFSVDHQSCMATPMGFHGGIDWEYIQAMRKYLKGLGVGVSGGNDNDEYGREPAFSGRVIQFPGPVECTTLVSRYSGGQWVLFDKRRGDRFRVRFDDTPPTRPDAPELVDLKITDYCDAGCGYCYQGSTEDGKHANPRDVFRVLTELASMKVFEVAIGGGEATDHPQFMQFCDYAESQGITPNLTTRNYRFVRDNYKWCAETLGTIAVSVDSQQAVKRVRALMDLNESDLKFNVQVVAGGVYDMNAIIKEAGESYIPLTLLGFKEQNRGTNFRQRPYPGWLEAVREHYKYRGFNVDTAFLHKHRTELEQMVGEDRFHKYAVLYEGMHSCYIDAVEMKIAPSSFCDPSLYRRITSVQNDWLSMEPV